jgi:AcrR family transcriptional regulator
MSETPQKLPGGRHNLSREEVSRHQRIRMLEAMVRTVGETSYAETSVQDVLERAGVSRKTFYEHFADKQACFLEAYEAVIRRVLHAVNAAYREGADWPDGIRRGLQVLLGFFAHEPAIGRMAFMEVLAAGPEAVIRYRNAVDAFVPYLEEGRKESSYGRQLPPSIPQGIAVAVAGLIYRRVAAGETERVPELEPDLLYLVLLPFLGPKRTAAIVGLRS